MARLLVVEDDPAQLDLRVVILERAGYEVVSAASAAEAMERAHGCELVVMDLVPGSEQLLKSLAPEQRVIVLSGWHAHQKPLSRPVADFLVKPCSTKELLESIARVCALAILLAIVLAGGMAQTFQAHAGSEIVAELDLAAPGTDWAVAGHEAALATVLLDGKPRQNVMLYAGAERHTYAIFLGPLTPGEHRLSLAGTQFEQLAVRFREDRSDVLAHAPILYARPNTIGKFTDIPLLMYCERLHEAGFPVLQYTVIYSNEDGGTPTRALMARWGRTADIEWVYKAFLNAGGAIDHATIQAADHKEIPFAGKREGLHPVLITATDNNNVAYGAVSAVRYQIPPEEANLDAHSREELMDRHPFIYAVMAKELIREHKLRPYGVAEGDKVGDPRSYLFLEAKVANRNSAVGLIVRLHNTEQRWHASHLGHPDFGIGRDGWVRTTVELPPGTKPEQIAEIGFECLMSEKKIAGGCEVLVVTRCFFLDEAYRPGPDIWKLLRPYGIPTGQMLTWAVR